ncbi:hypothetical protein ABPG75_009082 [Micractinium tetrahymenae]
MAPQQASIAALPDPLLGTILGLVGASEGASLTLVNKRFHRLFYSEPTLWRALTLAPGPAPVVAAWLASKHALLRRVAGLVSQLTVLDHEVDDESAGADATVGAWQLAGEGPGALPLAAFFDLLPRPEALRTLALGCNSPLDAAALHQALRFPRLQDLSLTAIMLPHETPSILARLPVAHLRRLTCRSLFLPEGIVEAIAQQLTGLTSLDLRSFTALPGDLQALTRLVSLRQLTLWEKNDGGDFAEDDRQDMCPPEPASLPALESFEYSCGQRRLQLAGMLLLRCSFEQETTSQPSCPGRGKLELAGAGGPAAPTLHQLLAALLPPAGAHAFDSLILHSCDLGAAALRGCPQLSQLAQLGLTGPRDRETLEAALDALLPQAPRLEMLCLCECPLAQGGLPACVAARAGLRGLAVLRAGLTALLPGPYLSSLRELYLEGNAFACLPPALAAATELRLLDIRGLALDVEAVELLAGLPALRGLRVGKGGAPDRVMRALRRRAPQLAVA